MSETRIQNWFETIYCATNDWTRGMAKSNVTIYVDADPGFGFPAQYLAVTHITGQGHRDLYQGESLEDAVKACQAEQDAVARRVVQNSTSMGGAQVQTITAGQVITPLAS